VGTSEATGDRLPTAMCVGGPLLVA